MVQTTAPRPQKSLAVAVTVAATVCGCAAGCRQRLPPAGWRLAIVAGWGAGGAVENVFLERLAYMIFAYPNPRQYIPIILWNIELHFFLKLIGLKKNLA